MEFLKVPKIFSLRNYMSKDREDYMLLNTTWAKILNQILKERLLCQPLLPLRAPPDRRGSKHSYEYHRDIEQTTEDFYQLKREIESFTWRCHLKNFVDKEKPKKHSVSPPSGP